MKRIFTSVIADKQNRGSGLATVLVVTAVTVTLAFTVVGLSFHHLSSTNRVNNATRAKNLAEAAVAKGINAILADPNFSTRTGSAATINVTLAGSPDGAFGALSFDATEVSKISAAARVATCRKSTYNLKSDAPLDGDGCKVPGYAVHFSAIGVCQGTARKVDAVIYVPRFPWAIAASGSISSTGNMLLASLREGGDPSKPEDLLPGSLATNSDAGSNAVKFSGGNITVKGDLQSHTGATLGSATVTGETRLNAAKVAIPALDLTKYNTASSPGVKNLSEIQSSSKVSGYNHRTGNLICASGLNLDGGVVYVDGDLTVQGGISGSGAVVVTGKSTILGTTTFSGENKVAILSKGDIQLSGESANPSSVKGLIYTEGNVQADHTRIRGSILANDKGGAGGKIGLSDGVEVYSESTATNFTVTVKTGGGGPSASDPAPAGKNFFLATVGADDIGATPWTEGYNAIANATKAGMSGVTSYTGPSERFSQAPQSSFPVPPFPGISGEFLKLPVSFAVKSTVTPDRFWDAAQQKYIAPVRYDVNHRQPRDLDGDGYTEMISPGVYQAVIDDPNNSASGYHFVPYTGSVPPLQESEFDVKVGSNAVADMSSASWKADAKALYLQGIDNLLTSKGLPVMTTLQRTIAGSMFDAQVTSQQLMKFINAGPAWGLAYADSKRVAPTQTITFQDATDPSYVAPAGTTTTENWSINLNDNDLIPLADRVRVLYWRDVPL